MPLVATLRDVDQVRNAHRGLSDGLGRCSTRYEGSISYERNQYFVRSADRPVHASAARLEAQAETADHRVSIATDLSILRTDHISTESSLPGVWRG